MLTDSSEMKASQAFLDTPLQPRKSRTDMHERRRRYFRHVSVSLLQPVKETHAKHQHRPSISSSPPASCKLIPVVTSQVEFGERVSGGGAHCRQQVDGVVCEAVAVGQVQLGQMGHVADDQAHRGVADVQASQTQILHIPQLAAIVTAWGKREGKNLSKAGQTKKPGGGYSTPDLPGGVTRSLI